MKERPILFSAPMVRAILSGSKSQTRRVVKPQPRILAGELLCWKDDALTDDQMAACSPYGQPGDRLRVKEAAWMWCERRPNGKTKTGRDKWVYVPMREAPIHYAADHPKKPAIDVVSPTTGNTWGWRLKIGRFLPRWASRITLEVTGVRVERLNSISEADADAECFGGDYPGKVLPEIFPGPPDRWSHLSMAQCYGRLWESINGAGSWDANPWVWCVAFRRLETAC